MESTSPIHMEPSSLHDRISQQIHNKARQQDAELSPIKRTPQANVESAHAKIHLTLVKPAEVIELKKKKPVII